MSRGHGRPVDEAEALVWCEAIRLRALTLAERLREFHAGMGFDGADPDCVLCQTIGLLREVANA
jgi:hypothetical protein